MTYLVSTQLRLSCTRTITRWTRYGLLRVLNCNSCASHSKGTTYFFFNKYLMEDEPVIMDCIERKLLAQNLQGTAAYLNVKKVTVLMFFSQNKCKILSTHLSRLCYALIYHMHVVLAVQESPGSLSVELMPFPLPFIVSTSC